MPGEADRIRFIPDTWAHRFLFRAGERLPARVSYFTLGWLSRLLTQVLARRIARRMIREHKIDVVHQPIPVSPMETSILHRMGAPVIIGPMNGGMSFPPGMRQTRRGLAALAERLGKRSASILNLLMPGKLRAEILLVANERTRVGLPPRARGRVVQLVENGIEPAAWEAPERAATAAGRPVRFVFVGRLIDVKAVDLLLEAFKQAGASSPATLDILGDGPLRPSLEAQAKALGLDGTVRFVGWLSHREVAERLREADALVMPSLMECGGAVVMEAMMAGLPVIATRWGGPADYLDPSCGILVDPVSRAGFIEGLTGAMTTLARSPELRRDLGRAAREKALREFTWDRKVDRILEIYASAVGRPPDVA